MPPLVRLFVRASFLYFLGAFLLGAFMALDSWLGLARWLRAVYLSQLHLLVVGWITQLAIGVAYWMFPRFRKEENPEPRGSDKLTWAVFVLLNAGLLLRFAFEPFYLMGPSTWLAATVALAGVLQALAALGFAALIWGRVRPMEP
jgi:cbb3-type cytochrome oxidase subunit 1